METHLKVGKIPDPSNHPDAALKALIAHYECMEHASRYIELSGDAGTEGEILTGTYLKKLLSFIPLRVRQDHDEFDDAETTTEKRRGQYKKIKEWILKIRKKLLSSGTNMEDILQIKLRWLHLTNKPVIVQEIQTEITITIMAEIIDREMMNRKEEEKGKTLQEHHLQNVPSVSLFETKL